MRKPITCAECLCECDSAETLYKWMGVWICEDCFRDKITDLSWREIADYLDVETATAEEFLYDD